MPKSWAFPTRSRNCVQTFRSWMCCWRRSGTWPSLVPATPKCPTWLKSLFLCCAITCPAGGRGDLRISLRWRTSCALMSRQSTSISCWAVSWKLWSTTLESTRPPGWRGWRVSFTPLPRWRASAASELQAGGFTSLLCFFSVFAADR